MYSFLHLLHCLVPNLLPVWSNYIGPFYLQKVQLLENCYKKFFEANYYSAHKNCVNTLLWGKQQVKFPAGNFICSILVESKNNDSPFHIKFPVAHNWLEYFFLLRAFTTKVIWIFQHLDLSLFTTCLKSRPLSSGGRVLSENSWILFSNDRNTVSCYVFRFLSPPPKQRLRCGEN